MPSIIKVEEIGKTLARPIDDEAKDIFLATLEGSGSYADAAAAARPHLSNRGSAVSAFRQLEDRDPDFAARVVDAYAVVAAKGEREMNRRAFEGIVEKVKYAVDPETGRVIKDSEGNPELVEQTVKYDTSLLVQVTRNALRRLDPDAYAPPTAKKQVTVTNNSTSVNATLDLDKLIEKAPREFRDFLFKFAEEQKQLASGGQKEPIDVKESE